MFLVNKKNQGQVALIVLLLSAVIMTLGLSVSRKTITETKLTTDEELLKKAFSAAESGIEHYLGTKKTDYISEFDNTKATVAIQNIGSTETLGSEDEEILAGNNAIFWLVGHNSNGAIDYSNYYRGDLANTQICVENDFSGEIKIDGYYLSGTNYQSLRWFINNYGGIFDNSCGTNYKTVANLGEMVGNTPLLLVVKPISQNTSVILKGNSSFPVQGEIIRSTGYAGNVESGTVSQKLSIKKSYQVPEFLLEPITTFGSVLSN